MITYYDNELSPNCFKTRMVLEEFGIKHELRSTTFAEMKTGALAERFPSGALPALSDGDIHLSESGAIAIYLCGRYAKQMLPDTAAGRALLYQALFLEAALLAPVIGGQGIFGQLGRPEGERDMDRVQTLMPEAQRVARVLASVLGDREWFAGKFSVADIQIYIGVSKAIEHAVFENPPAMLVAWKERMDARPSVVKMREHYVLYRTKG